MGKYLFLYLKTGGGYLAPAKAVAEKIKTKRRVDIEINLIDGLSESNLLVKKIIENGYKNAINKAAWTFEFLYALHKIKLVSKFTAFLVSYFVKPGLEKQILETTSMEILIRGKVPVINNYIWEQEKGNMEFVCQGKMGILEKNTNTLPEVLHKLLTDNEFYNSIINNIKKASISNGVGKVSDYILKFE